MQILHSQSVLRMKPFKAALPLGMGSKSSQTMLCHGARLHPDPGHLPSPVTLCSSPLLWPALLHRSTHTCSLALLRRECTLHLTQTDLHWPVAVSEDKTGYAHAALPCLSGQGCVLAVNRRGLGPSSSYLSRKKTLSCLTSHIAKLWVILEFWLSK